MSQLPDVTGCLMGIAVGDSLGLPFEGLSARRVERRLRSDSLRQSLLFGRGMLSDDTEQSSIVLEAFIVSKGDLDRFRTELARRLRNWFLAIPAGVGLATARACIKLTAGGNPATTGVDSAGNGAAMRAPILGSLIPRDPESLHGFVQASSLITHKDQRAIDGAWVVACAVSLSKDFVGGTTKMDGLLAAISERCESPVWERMLNLISDRYGTASPIDFAKEVGDKGRVTGYVMQSVPVAIFTWLSLPHEPKKGIETVIRLGGDTDTTAAMLGALYGASLGVHAFPTDWLQRIADWPRSTEYLQELVDSKDDPEGMASVYWLATAARNAFFLPVVITHGLRRLWP